MPGRSPRPGGFWLVERALQGIVPPVVGGLLEDRISLFCRNILVVQGCIQVVGSVNVTCQRTSVGPTRVKRSTTCKLSLPPAWAPKMPALGE